MADLLTTRQLQEILRVDRTTIYRMAESGRLPAVKVGNQWRFPRDQIETWLQRQSAVSAPIAEFQPAGNGDGFQLFPLDCVQLIQDSFADALGVTRQAVHKKYAKRIDPSIPVPRRTTR